MLGWLTASETGEADMNYLGLAVWKGAYSPTMLHMFLYFSVPSLFVNCTN